MRASILCLVTLAVLAAPASAYLVNGGFESAREDGTPSGWTILHGLDPHRYGPPELLYGFDEVIPVQGEGGLGNSNCLAFPAQGVWACEVFTHSNADGKGIDGRVLGKAAAYQPAMLPPGAYRFGAWLRTAGGHRWSAAFSLGHNIGLPADYAHDDSSGIQWTDNNLGESSNEIGSARNRGDWAWYETQPFTLDEPTVVTVWIRFNYRNENQFHARWQVDDAAIVPVVEVPQVVADPADCVSPPEPIRHRVFCGMTDEPYLVDAGGSEIIDATYVRLFRQARQLTPGQTLRYRFPLPPGEEGYALLVAGEGGMRVEAGGQTFEVPRSEQRGPVTMEWPIPSSLAVDGHLEVALQPSGDDASIAYEVELSNPSRTEIRVRYVPTDFTRVLWTLGSWDGASREFTGEAVRKADMSLHTSELNESGPVEIIFNLNARPGMRYWLIHGLLHGTASYDFGMNGVIDWVATIQGLHIVNVDITDHLQAGNNGVRIDPGEGRHDFFALLETCEGALDLSSLKLAFEGDELAEIKTRVMHSTWFWLKELHYEPSGFVDASIPHGHWFNEYWPIDIAFALREWTRWGYQDEAELITRLSADIGWHGHDSNRSGGWDNTGGNILVRAYIETLRRADGDPELVAAVWPTIVKLVDEAIASAEKSPFGLVKGTNWENAGNLQRGPCYAISTTLGAAACMVGAALLAEQFNLDAPVDAWRGAAAGLRAAVLEHLIVQEDHTTPTGWVMPAGTWAYGLREDGSYEDEPLAGYFWAAAAMNEMVGMDFVDPDLGPVYSRTLDAGMPLVRHGHRGAFTGYAVSYDGTETMLVSAAHLDRVDLFHDMLDRMLEMIDHKNERLASRAELSRWAVGGGGPEDTNLVGTASYMWSMRTLAGIDDVLADGRQLRLIPRLPVEWTALHVNDWPTRARDDSGQEQWANLTVHLQRDDEHARMTLMTDKPLKDIEVRLGPFPADQETFDVTVNGRRAEGRPLVSGAAAWVWVTCNTGPQETVVEVKARN